MYFRTEFYIKNSKKQFTILESTRKNYRVIDKRRKLFVYACEITFNLPERYVFYE